jgi:TatD DNase family protein
VPHRGKRNEPAYLLETVKYLAAIRGTTPEELAESTTGNFQSLLRDAKPLAFVPGLPHTPGNS